MNEVEFLALPDGTKLRTGRTGELRWIKAGKIVDKRGSQKGTHAGYHACTYELVAVPASAQVRPGTWSANNDAGGSGKQTNPKDLVGSRKVPLSTLPWRVLWRVGLAMLEGMVKYGRHNYRIAGVRASVYFDSVVSRHLGSWWEGEDLDPESGFNHIDKAIAGLMVLRDSMLEGNWVDDRPPSGAEDMAALNAEAARIVDQYKGKNPRHWTIMDTKEKV